MAFSYFEMLVPKIMKLRFSDLSVTKKTLNVPATILLQVLTVIFTVYSLLKRQATYITRTRE